MAFDTKHLKGFNNTLLDEQTFFRKYPEIRLQNINNEIFFYLFDKNWSIDFDVNTTSLFTNEEILNVFNFAFESKNKHKQYRSGGTLKRNEIQIFYNIFLGKLGEIAAYNSLIKNNIELETRSIDFTIRELGDWDDYDLKTKTNKLISVKSSKHWSQMMLLETKNWNKNSELIYNINTNKSYLYDFHLYSRIVPLKVFNNKKYIYPKGYQYIDLNYSNNNELKDKLFKHITEFKWAYEDSFIINNEYFKKIIKMNYILESNKYVVFDSNVLFNLSKKSNTIQKIEEYKQNCYLNNQKFKLDASNYYFPLKYMFKLEDYTKYL